MMKLDATDLKLLTILQDNGRISNTELADEIALSASPCWRRVRRLEEGGLIRKYVTLLDPRQLGFGVSAFVTIRMDNNQDPVIEEFESLIVSRAEVLECYRMSGGSDYLVRVVVRDIASYERFLSKVLLQCPGVASVDTSFALKQVKYSTALPVEAASTGS